MCGNIIAIISRKMGIYVKEALQYTRLHSTLPDVRCFGNLISRCATNLLRGISIHRIKHETKTFLLQVFLECMMTNRHRVIFYVILMHWSIALLQNCTRRTQFIYQCCDFIVFNHYGNWNKSRSLSRWLWNKSHTANEKTHTKKASRINPVQ